MSKTLQLTATLKSRLSQKGSGSLDSTRVCYKWKWTSRINTYTASKPQLWNPH